jgi:cysteine synthase B
MIITEYKTPLLERVYALEPFIGKTPMIEIRNAHHKPGVKIFAKLEWQQFSGSVKARAAFQIIKDAIESNQLREDSVLLDASSGNTAIAYAAVCASLGINVKICLPENASLERKRLLKAYGAAVHYTSPFGGTDEAQEAARSIYLSYPERYYYADQYSNNSNWRAHYLNTGNEIISQTQEQITHFVCGLGTTGTFTGTSRRLKEFNPNVQVISLMPDASLHGMEGWKHLPTARVPGIYDPVLADKQLTVDTESAWDMVKQIARTEGLLVSPSSAANLVGAIRVAEQLDEGIIVTVFPDSAERYSEVLNELYNHG